MNNSVTFLKCILLMLTLSSTYLYAEGEDREQSDEERGALDFLHSQGEKAIEDADEIDAAEVEDEDERKRIGALPYIKAKDVIKSAITCEDCIDWHPVGICFWLKCSLFECSVEESIKIHQNLPDLVVATHTSSLSPLYEIRKAGINDVKSANLTDKNQDHSGIETYLDFKHAEVVGNPAVVFFNMLHDSEDEYFCKSGVEIPYYPYFLSGLDPSWSDTNLEAMLASLYIFPIRPKIKTNFPLGYWAPIYPRCGWGHHPYDAINGAVAAHRAAMITTSSDAPHIYIKPSTDCGNRCWPPSKVETGNIDNHMFQLIFPAKTGPMVMGGSARWANRKNIGLDEGYVWNLWRPYECCKKKGQAFLFSIDW